MNALPVSYPHYPSPRTTLASTRKRVRFCCSVKPSQLWWGLLPICTINEIFRTIPPTFRRGGARSSCCIDPLHFYNLCKRTLITCLARPSRCTEYCHPHNHCKRTIIPRPALNLPPLSKGGGLTARHKLLLCCVLLAICPLFLYCKLFCRQDGGIASVASTLSIPTTFSKAHPSPRLAPSLPTPHPSISHYSPSNIHFLPAYP